MVAKASTLRASAQLAFPVRVMPRSSSATVPKQSPFCTLPMRTKRAFVGCPPGSVATFGVRGVRHYRGAAALAEKGGLALVILVGDEDPGSPAQGLELLQIGCAHGDWIDEHIALGAHPEVAVEVQLAQFAENGPAILQPGSSDDLGICDGDEDWFLISLPVRGALSIGMQPAPDSGDLDMELLNGAFLQVESSTNAGVQAELIAVDAVGEHYLRIYGYEGETGAYSLDLDY